MALTLVHVRRAHFSAGQALRTAHSLRAAGLRHRIYLLVHLAQLIEPLASPATLAADLEVSERSVRRALGKLDQRGFSVRGATPCR